MSQQSIDWKKEVENRKDDLLEDLKALLRINSVKDAENATEEAPVGQGPLDALNAFMAIAEKDGFKTETFGNLAGHIEYSDGNETLGILAHVDVVPVDDGWETDPFDPVIKDNRIYARGSSDDKGPAIAAYYGLKIIKELGLPLSKRIRYIVGTDEESDWIGMDHYFSVNEEPDFGFSPDANFPIINGEKGNVSINLDFSGKSDGDLVLSSFQAGQRPNMVPQDAIAVLKATNAKALTEAFDVYVADQNVNGEAEVEDATVTLKLHGKASHGAQPQNGVNAGTHLANFLTEAGLSGDAQIFVSTISQYLHDDPYAEKLGLKITDDVMGELTMNVGIMSFKADEGGHVDANFRFPKNTDGETLKQGFVKNVDEAVVVTATDAKEPHYVPADDPLVKTLLDVYERQSGLEGHEQVIGGGTYGRMLKRGVAFGAQYPDSIDTMHQDNEFMSLDDLFNSAAIYAEAIYELAK